MAAETQWNSDTNLPISDDKMLLMEVEDETPTWSRAQITNLDILQRDNMASRPTRSQDWIQGAVMGEDAPLRHGGYMVASSSTLDTNPPRDPMEDPSGTSSYHRDYCPPLEEAEHREVMMESRLHRSMKEDCDDFLHCFQQLPEDQCVRILQEMQQMQQQGPSAEALPLAAAP